MHSVWREYRSASDRQLVVPMSEQQPDEPHIHVRSTHVPRTQSTRGPGATPRADDGSDMPAVPGRVVSGSAVLTGGRVESRGKPAPSKTQAPTQAPKINTNLPGLPSAPLTPEQHAEAVKRVQAQAEQRVKLGTQLFKAAEATIAEHVSAVEKARKQQHELREEIQQDVAKSLQAYDQWLGQIDEGFTNSIKKIEHRVDQLEQGCLAMEEAWHETEQRLETLMVRAEAMVDASRDMLEQCDARLAAKPAAHPEPLRPEKAPAHPMMPPAPRDQYEPPQPQTGHQNEADDASTMPAADAESLRPPTLKLSDQPPAARSSAEDSPQTNTPPTEPPADPDQHAPTPSSPPPLSASRGVSAFETEPDDTDPNAPEPIRYTQIIEQIKKARENDNDRPRPA